MTAVFQPDSAPLMRILTFSMTAVRCFRLGGNGSIKMLLFPERRHHGKNAWIGTSYVDENGVWDTSKTTTSKTGWKQDKNGWWYVHADGSYTKMDGKTIDGEKYYFDSTGYRHIGWLYLNQTYYYFDLSTGILKTGWVKVENTGIT